MPINDKPETAKPVLIKKSTIKKTDDPPKVEAIAVNVPSEPKKQPSVTKKEAVVANNKVLASTSIQPVQPVQPVQPIVANVPNVVGKMSIVVKMTEMPKQHNKLENFISEFTIDMQTMQLVIRTPHKMFGKFFRAKRESLQWVATIEGKVSQLTDAQIIVEDAKIFVINKELKPANVVAAQAVAKELGEKDYRTNILIIKLIDHLGIETINILMQQAKEVFLGDGLWLEDEQRKRTFGGVFLFLAKQKISKEDWLTIARKKVKKTPDDQQQENSTPLS